MRAVMCGAGIAGLAIAGRLWEHGWEVSVVEQAPGPREQGYMVDFFGLGYAAAEAMGLRSRLHELGYEISEWVYADRGGRVRAGISFKSFGTAMHGRLVSIMRNDLETALRESVESRVELRFATSVEAFEQDDGGGRVGLSDGDTVDADLLVGADGIHSRARSLMFGASSSSCGIWATTPPPGCSTTRPCWPRWMAGSA